MLNSVKEAILLGFPRCLPNKSVNNLEIRIVLSPRIVNTRESSTNLPPGVYRGCAFASLATPRHGQCQKPHDAVVEIVFMEEAGDSNEAN